MVTEPGFEPGCLPTEFGLSAMALCYFSMYGLWALKLFNFHSKNFTG